MLVSLCVPVHNRSDDLRHSLPFMVDAANASPPAEISILDYASTDRVLETAMLTGPLHDGVSLVYHRYSGRSYFHKAHAFNLAVLSGTGAYRVLLGADACPEPGYIPALRRLIERGCVWMRGPHLKGIVCISADEFVACGGYDERFEFYGPEDRDLEARLLRRGATFGLLPDGLMHVIVTPDEEKIKNYRLPLSKREMSALGHAILDENNASGALVANAGQEWGRWNA